MTISDFIIVDRTLLFYPALSEWSLSKIESQSFRNLSRFFYSPKFQASFELKNFEIIRKLKKKIALAFALEQKNIYLKISFYVKERKLKLFECIQILVKFLVSGEGESNKVDTKIHFMRI